MVKLMLVKIALRIFKTSAGIKNLSAILETKVTWANLIRPAINEGTVNCTL